MIQNSKQADEVREAGNIECWCLHGAVGMAADFRKFSQHMADAKYSTRAVDLWRFLSCDPMPLPKFGPALNADASGNTFRGKSRALLGYSMGGRLALHALLEKNHPWQAAIIIGAHPGLEEQEERENRAANDAEWASKALMGSWEEFSDAWNAQPILANTSIRSAQDINRLALRRREIARSFVDWSLGAQQPLWDRLPEITIPVLWVVGENDSKFLPLADRATQLLPNAKLAIAPNSGHRVPWEAEEWLAQTVSSFLKQGA